MEQHDHPARLYQPEPEVMKTVRPGPADSPPPNCAICLGTCTNKCFTDCCLHQFCFSCLLEWSKIKAECPLCKQPFKSIIYNIKSNSEYEEHIITNPEREVENEDLLLGEYLFLPNGPRPQRHFQFRTTLTLEPGGEFAIQELLLSHPRTNSIYIPSDRYSDYRLHQQTLEQRRNIYHEGLWVISQPDITGRYRECSPPFFRENPAQAHRLVPWLNRELMALLEDDIDAIRLQHRILAMLYNFHILSSAFRANLAPYLGTRTDHFIHEFYNYARSQYDMIGYDRHATYSSHPPPIFSQALSDDDDSDVRVVDSPANDDCIFVPPPNPEIIVIDSDSSDSDVIVRTSPTPPAPPPIVDLIDTDSDDTISVASQQPSGSRSPQLPIKIRLKLNRYNGACAKDKDKRPRRKHRSPTTSTNSSPNTSNSNSQSDSDYCPNSSISNAQISPSDSSSSSSNYDDNSSSSSSNNEDSSSSSSSRWTPGGSSRSRSRSRSSSSLRSNSSRGADCRTSSKPDYKYLQSLILRRSSKNRSSWRRKSQKPSSKQSKCPSKTGKSRPKKSLKETNPERKGCKKSAGDARGTRDERIDGRRIKEEIRCKKPDTDTREGSESSRRLLTDSRETKPREENKETRCRKPEIDCRDIKDENRPRKAPSATREENWSRRAPGDSREENWLRRPEGDCSRNIKEENRYQKGPSEESWSRKVLSDSRDTREENWLRRPEGDREVKEERRCRRAPSEENWSRRAPGDSRDARAENWMRKPEGDYREVKEENRYRNIVGEDNWTRKALSDFRDAREENWLRKSESDEDWSSKEMRNGRTTSGRKLSKKRSKRREESHRNKRFKRIKKELPDSSDSEDNSSSSDSKECRKRRSVCGVKVENVGSSSEHVQNEPGAPCRGSFEVASTKGRGNSPGEDLGVAGPSHGPCLRSVIVKGNNMWFSRPDLDDTDNNSD